MARTDGIQKSSDFHRDSEALTPVHSPRGVLATGQAIQPQAAPVDEYDGEGIYSTQRRIKELERKIGLTGSVWRDWTALRKSSLSIPNINNPFVRQHIINQERLRFLHYVPELRELTDGEETITNVWGGLSCLSR